MGVMAAAAIGGGLAAGGAIGGSFIGASASKKASKKQNKLLKKLFEEEQRRNALIEARTKPFVDVGTRALKTLAGTATAEESLGSFTDTESFRFRQEEIERQTRRALGFRGNLFSGAGIEAEERAGLILSGEESDRNQRILLALSEQGLNAAVQAGSVGASSLAAVGNQATSIGGNIATLQQSRGNVIAGGVNQATGIFGGLVASGALTPSNNQQQVSNQQILDITGNQNLGAVQHGSGGGL